MDILIKNNIVKWNKIVIDVGEHTTKVLNVHYAAKQVTVKCAENFDSSFISADREINFDELASKIDMCTSGKGRKDISITLPEFLVENRLISLKNKKEKEVDDIIKKEYVHFGKVSPITHVVDYAYLGKREESGDTVRYYLITAIQKSIANELISAFAEQKMKITTISCGVYNQCCLSELFFDEYEYLNRLLIDFGKKSTRITAFADGVAVYTRTVAVGFDSYVNSLFDAQTVLGKREIRDALCTVGVDNGEMSEEKEYDEKIDHDTYNDSVDTVNNLICGEIRRIIDLCENNDVTISKIYSTGFVFRGFKEMLMRETDIECEPVSFGVIGEKTGKGYVLTADEELGIIYSNALGMAVCPML